MEGGLCHTPSSAGVSFMVAMALSCQSCADISLTVAMALHAKAVRAYRTVAKEATAKIGVILVLRR